MIKKIVFYSLFSFVIPISSFSADFHQMLVFADSLVNFRDTDFSAHYTIVQDKPGEGKITTEAAIFRRDSALKYVIIILEPEINKGQGYLKLDETLWFYDPESRRFNSSSSKERFRNSNARNSDFTQSSLAQDYDVIKGEEVKLGKYNCWLLHLKANNDEVTYPEMKIWISEDGLVRKTEDYSLSHQLLRTTAIPDYNKIGKSYVPSKILFIDALKGAVIDGKMVHEKTQITITKPSVKDIPDYVFSKTFLENVSK
ncbi:MAG: outer membrane lipoprotein-sorting protein [Spirochaetales bacterium]|nr:outer membrane lipoprotein-sorting protein [Spirochaetales bacterium]